MRTLLIIGGLVLLYLIFRNQQAQSPYVSPTTTGYMGGLLPVNAGSPIPAIASIVNSSSQTLQNILGGLNSSGSAAVLNASQSGVDLNSPFAASWYNGGNPIS